MVNSSNKNCLDIVILKFDFINEITIPDNIVDDVARNLSSAYRYEPVEKINWNVNMQSNQMVTETKKIKAHVFKNELGNSITLEPISILFEIKDYKGYDEFMKLVKNILNLLQINNEEIRRLGLRYINNIKLPEGDPFDWNDYIVPGLTRINDFLDITGIKYLSTRNLGQIFLKKSYNSLDYSLVFIYGWPNSEFPNHIAKKEFVLDYDCYTENNLKLSETYEYIDVFHTEIENMFVKSIDKELKKMIGEDKFCVV